MGLDQFILFGDSITQQADIVTDGYSFASQLRHAFDGKYDITVHGYPGSNTDQALGYVKDVIPSPDKATVRLLTIWFGTNDAGVMSYVPIDKFKENVKSIINSSEIKAHGSNIHIILITPPPIEETLLADFMKKNFGFEGPLNMTAKSAAQYAKVVLELAKELEINSGKEVIDNAKNLQNEKMKQSAITDQHTPPVSLPVVALDVWGEFMSAAGWIGGELPGSISLGKNQVLSELLIDGVHLTPAGYKKVYSILMNLLKAKWPELM